MKIPSISELIRSKLLIAGLLFIGVNLTYRYDFYQVNSYKILVVLIGVSLIAFWNDLLFPGKLDKRIPWKQVFIVSIPLLATLPGYLWYQGTYNYNFRYELASNLVLIVWVTYLYRGVQQKEDLYPFFFLMGITVIYVGSWAFLEKIGYHPLEWGTIPPTRVKSTFGNINYFAGFLVVLLPLLLSFCLPEKLPATFSFKKLFPGKEKAAIFYLIVFFIAGLSLILTQTRAAQAAALVALVSAVFFYALGFAPVKWQNQILIIGLIGFVFSVVIIVLLFIFSDYLPENRYTRLFTLAGWTPRFAGWVPAINSIKASPLIGFGLGSSYNLYFAFTDPNARLLHTEHSYNHVHSEFLEYTQEAGLVGLILFVAFWSFIAYTLLKTIRSEQVDPLLKKLAIGIVAGLIGYHVHSAFSVAPRMMVVKLPMFTLIGLTLIIAKISTIQSDWISNKTLSGSVTSFVPALMVLGFTWTIILPWLVGQYLFVNIQRDRPSLLKVEKLEKMVKDYPDAYALDYLSHLQIQYRRTDQLEQTIKIIDKVLPDYRELGHTKAVLAIMQQNLPKAKETALDFQYRQDTYHKPTISLLMGLAFDTNDYQLFKTQFQLFIRKLVFDHNLYYSLKAENVVVEVVAMDQPFEIMNQKNRFLFNWNERLIQTFFNTARSVRINRAFSQKDRDTFLSFLAFHFSRHPYFQLNIKKEYQESGPGEINDAMKTYFTTSQQWQQKSKELETKQRAVLIRTAPADRPSLGKKQKEERDEIYEPYRLKLEESSEYLLKRTDWNDYLRKRGFVSTFIEEFTNVIYPLINTK